MLALVIVAAALGQVTAGPSLAVGGAEPNLVLALVVARAWLAGTRSALWPAVLGGLLLDLSARGPLGVHALALVGATLAAGWLAERHLQGHTALAALAGPPALAAYSGLVLAAAALLRQPLPNWPLALILVLVGCVVQALLCPLAVLLLNRPHRRALA